MKYRPEYTSSYTEHVLYCHFEVYKLEFRTISYLNHVHLLLIKPEYFEVP